MRTGPAHRQRRRVAIGGCARWPCEPTTRWSRWSRRSQLCKCRRMCVYNEADVETTPSPLRGGRSQRVQRDQVRSRCGLTGALILAAHSKAVSYLETAETGEPSQTRCTLRDRCKASHRSSTTARSTFVACWDCQHANTAGGPAGSVEGTARLRLVRERPRFRSPGYRNPSTGGILLKTGTAQ